MKMKEIGHRGEWHAFLAPPPLPIGSANGCGCSRFQLSEEKTKIIWTKENEHLEYLEEGEEEEEKEIEEDT